MDKKNKSSLVSIKMNNYVKIGTSQLLTQTNKYVTNGVDNSFFYHVEDMYVASSTNAAIIDGMSNYIYGDGLKMSNGEINKLISRNDLRLLVKDLKMHGAFALQVVYTRDRESIAKLHHLPVRTIAIAKQDDITDAVENYWYCFDWRNKSKFKPQLIPAFGTSDEDTELFYVSIPSTQPLFALPDYVQCLQYCDLEQELSNFYINHIKNNFSAGKIINVNQGIPETDEAQEEAERAILGKVQGTNQAGNIIISFNDNKENATTVENIQIEDAYQQFEFISQEAVQKIMLAHKVNDPALFGLPMASGFASVSEQLITSLRILYRNQINPLREIILDNLETLLSMNEIGTLEFIDFEELRVEKAGVEKAIEPTNNENEIITE